MIRLVLWDVDNTMINNGGVSKAIYRATFTKITGQEVRLDPRTGGRTDPEIIADLFTAHGLPPEPWPVVLPVLKLVGEEHQGLLRRYGFLLPGVWDLISALEVRAGVIQSIVTGNIRANVEVKLGPFGVLPRLNLDVGAYGSDHSERYELVRLARRRAATQCDPRYGDRANVVVIGDTPRDVHAAKFGGARCLAVSTGVHTADELRLAGADYVVESLSDTADAVAFVLA